MNVLINEDGNPLPPPKLNKSKDIICPTCGENILISFKNYKISLLDCKNGHIIYLTFFKTMTL